MGLFDVAMSSPSQSSENKADLLAINDYMRRIEARTEAAGKLKSQWGSWYPNLGILDMYDPEVLREAVNKRNAFNIANTETPDELEHVRSVMATGVVTNPDLKKGRDPAGNFPKQKGITVASSAKGTVPAGARPTIRQGSKGEPVKAWQAIIGVTTDGNFGPQTAAATKAWQKEHGLTADGVVGAATWGAALKASVGEMSFQQAAVTPVAPSTIPASKVPTGTVAQVSATKKPVASKPVPPVGVSPKIVAVSEKQLPKKPEGDLAIPAPAGVATAGMLPSIATVKKHWKPIAIGTGALTVLGGIVKLVRR